MDKLQVEVLKDMIKYNEKRTEKIFKWGTGENEKYFSLTDGHFVRFYHYLEKYINLENEYFNPEPMKIWDICAGAEDGARRYILTRQRAISKGGATLLKLIPEDGAGDVVYINEKYTKYFDLSKYAKFEDMELYCKSRISPVIVKNNGVMHGVILPVNYVE